MDHITPEALQQYLAGEASLHETQHIDEHLSSCTACADLLAILASEDTFLTQMLQLETEEMAWVTATDLTSSVMTGIRRPIWSAQILLPTILIIATGAWGLHIGMNLVEQAFVNKGAMGVAANVLPFVLALLWEALLYIAEGGLLTTIWPALVLGLVVWLWRSKQMEETNHA